MYGEIGAIPFLRLLGPHRIMFAYVTTSRAQHVVRESLLDQRFEPCSGSTMRVRPSTDRMRTLHPTARPSRPWQSDSADQSSAFSRTFPQTVRKPTAGAKPSTTVAI